jgi:hypothetical protein
MFQPNGAIIKGLRVKEKIALVHINFLAVTFKMYLN